MTYLARGRVRPAGSGPSFDLVIGEEEAVVGVEQWAELRRMHQVERLSIREINWRTGSHRRTIRRAPGASTPPRLYGRAGGLEVGSV